MEGLLVPKSVAPPSFAPIDLRGKLPTLDLSQWPSSHAYYPRDIAGITGITLHYTASPAIVTPQEVAAYQISAAAAPQTGADPPQPFPGIAYTLFVDGAGVVYLCWGLDVRVWHSGAVVNGIARNASHVGICYGGDYEPDVAQLHALRNAIRWCEQQLGRTLTIEGHGDVYPTACCGPTRDRWIPVITSMQFLG